MLERLIDAGYVSDKRNRWSLSIRLENVWIFYIIRKMFWLRSTFDFFLCSKFKLENASC